MRKLSSQIYQTRDVQKELDKFSSHMSEIGMEESDIVSVSVMPTTFRNPEPGKGGLTMCSPPIHDVVVVYWTG